MIKVLLGNHQSNQSTNEIIIFNLVFTCCKFYVCSRNRNTKRYYQEKSRSSWPVSYTHLDVYKRQEQDKLGGQHKIPRLSNERDYLEQLIGMQIIVNSKG